MKIINRAILSIIASISFIIPVAAEGENPKPAKSLSWDWNTQKYVVDSPCDDSIRAKLDDARARSMNAPELCFEKDASCRPGDIQASDFWTNSDDPETVRGELLGNSDLIGRITTLAIPNGTGSLVRIARIGGTAHCVNDSYLHQMNGRYAVVHSESLDSLSGEGKYGGDGVCGGDGVEMLSDGKDILIVYDETVYRLLRSFDLQYVCQVSSKPKAK